MAARKKIQAQLQKKYVPPLESATLLAIASEYDVSNPAELRSLRKVLDAIASNADVEGSDDFDSSSNGGGVSLIDPECYEREGSGSTSAKSHPKNKSSLEDYKSDRGNPLSSLQSADGLQGDGRGGPDTSQFNELSQEGKEAFLVAMFPALRPFDVKMSLRKYKNNTNAVVDDLMNQSFLEENGERVKGIDGLEYLDRSNWSRKKGKASFQHLKNDDGTPVTAAQINLWEQVKKDAQFLAAWTNLSTEKVVSLYHKNAASLGPVINDILESQPAPSSASEDPAYQPTALFLSQEFPMLEKPYILALVRITYPSAANAYALAKAFVSNSPSAAPSSNSPIQINFKYAPIVLNSPSKATPRSAIGTKQLDGAAALTAAKFYAKSRDEAFLKASDAYRKSKSDPMMGGVAAHYSQIGRGFDARVKDAESDAADALVATHSSDTQLDLHGVDRKNAVRITRERVTAWWQGQGEVKLGNGGSAGYRIITGVGHHSEGGKPRLRPAVAKMLKKEGWKFETAEGYVVVTGVVMKK